MNSRISLPSLLALFFPWVWAFGAGSTGPGQPGQLHPELLAVRKFLEQSSIF